jgi:hypothetical protein
MRLALALLCACLSLPATGADIGFLNGETAIKAHVQTMLRKLDVPEQIIQAVVDTPPQSPRRLTEGELEMLEPFSYVPEREPQTAKAPN